jgi:hypothetical protein
VPVGIPSEHSCVGFTREVLNFVFQTRYVENEGMVEVVPGKRTYAGGAEKLVLVQHIGQDAFDLLFIANRQKVASFVSDESIVCGSDMLD